MYSVTIHFIVRWSNSPHSKGISECSAGNVSTTRHFPWRRCSMAGTFA